MSSRKEMIGQHLSAFLDASELDDTIRARFANAEARNQLISSLEDGTVYSILETLKDMQKLNENEIWNQREKKLEELRTRREDTADRIREMDLQILDQIEKIVDGQQCTLIAAGLPMFRQSMDEWELRLQMTIIRFILTIGDVYE